MFISGDTAMDAVRSDTLLVLGDVNSPTNVESRKLYDAVKSIAVVDHHRRTESKNDDRWKLAFISPQASSAGEMVCEMLEHSPYSEKLMKEEANLLLAGIVLDTKNFTQVSNMNLFSKVDYLSRCRAHTSQIRDLFSQTMENLIASCNIDSRTRTYRDIIALTWMSVDREATADDRIIMAKASDRLMAIVGIEASFALLRAGNVVYISARSKNRVNVQVIATRLGGGGHFDMAGAKLQNVSLDQACSILKAEIDNYLDNDYQKQDNEATTTKKHGEKK